MSEPIVLGIESTCDETAAAVLDGALEKLQRELAGRLQAQDVELKEVN